MKGETVFFALGELGEDLVHEAGRTPAKHPSHIRRLPLVAAAAVLLAALVSAMATGLPEKLHRLIRYTTGTGDEITLSEGGLRTIKSRGRDACILRDGHIFFLCWEEEIDITAKCSDTDYYAWECVYEDGVRQLLLAGGTPESMGWLTVYYLGDEVLCFDLPSAYDYAGAAWIGKAIEDYGLDFLRPVEPDFGDLRVPTTKELLENGYPVNDLGETYGPTVTWMKEPDLVLALGKNGRFGYLRQSEEHAASGGSVRSPEEAVAWTEKSAERGSVEVPLYREDGVTVVDWFVIGG